MSSHATTCFGKPNAPESRKFESKVRRNQIEFLRTTAGFYHPAEVGRKSTTTLHKDNGWGKSTSLCTEYAKPRNEKDSMPFASIDAHKQIGPVWNVGIAKVLDVYGIEVQVQSLSNRKFPTWFLISSGHERFVKELHLHNATNENLSSSLLRR